MPTSTWGITFENSLKQVLAYGSTASGASLTRTLNAPAELSVDLAITGQDTKALFDQLAVGSVYARLAEGSTTRFFGVLTDVQATVADSSTVTASFMDLSQQYATCFYYYAITSTKYCLRGYDGSGSQTTTVTNLMTDFTGAQSVALPLTVSGTATGSRQIEPGQEVSRLEILDGLAQLQNGLDWYVEPDQTIKIANALGTDKSKSIAFQQNTTGLANVLSSTVQWLPPRNRVLTSQEDGIVKVTKAGTTASLNAYGPYEVIVPRLQAGTATESDVADQVVRSSWRQTVNLELEPTVAPRPWTDFDLGDTVKVNVVTDAFSVDSSQRVNQITFGFNDQFVESSVEIALEVK